MNDHISDMLIRIKNAQRVRKEATQFGYSKIKWEIARVLEKTGYVGSVVRKGRKNKKLIEVVLLYDETTKKPMISEVRRISKLGRRVYRGYREIFAPKNGFGAAIYSTPKGLLTDRQARKEKVGGEVLFEIW